MLMIPTQKPEPKNNNTKPKSKATTKKGGSVLSDMSKLAVPFGLLAAKNTLATFIANRNKEMYSKTKPTYKKPPAKKSPTKKSPTKKSPAKKPPAKKSTV